MEDKLIIGPLQKESDFNEVVKYLSDKNYKVKPNSRMKSFVENCAVKINEDGDYVIGNFDRYVYYKQECHKDYKHHEVINFSKFKVTYLKQKLAIKLDEINVSNVSDEPIKFYGPIHKKEEIPDNIKIVLKEPERETLLVYKDNVLTAYNKISDPRIKELLRWLFGADMFIQRTYKIGDKFKLDEEMYAISKVNSNVVQLMNVKTFENYCTSKQVKDPYHISEDELRLILGFNYDRFEKVA